MGIHGRGQDEEEEGRGQAEPSEVPAADLTHHGPESTGNDDDPPQSGPGAFVKIEYAAGMPSGYQAGVCNIGPAEIARRRRGAVVALGIAAVVAIALVAFHLPDISRVVVFVPLAGGIVSFEQARRHFCAGFALAGIRNFGRLGTVEQVVDPSAVAADRRSASIMVAYSAAIAAVVTIVFMALPI